MALDLDAIDFGDNDDRTYYYFPGSYGTLMDAFGFSTLIEVHDNDYQGDSFYLLSDGNLFGILIFGWGSCSGCDALEACGSPEDVRDLATGLYESITWRSQDEMVEYLTGKDFSLEWWGDSYGEGKTFVKRLLAWFDITQTTVIDEDTERELSDWETEGGN